MKIDNSYFKGFNGIKASDLHEVHTLPHLHNCPECINPVRQTIATKKLKNSGKIALHARIEHQCSGDFNLAAGCLAITVLNDTVDYDMLQEIAVFNRENWNRMVQ